MWVVCAMAVCRAVCVTYPNPVDIPDMIAKLKGEDLFTYGIMGEETGEGGLFHLQGYLELARVTRLTTLIKRFALCLHLC